MLRTWSKAIWKERRYADGWSINHTLFGMLLAVAMYKLPVAVAFMLCLLAAVAWEIIERKFIQREFITNRISDVIVTLIGFFLARAAHITIETPALLWSLIATYCALEVWGHATQLLVLKRR